MPQAPYTLEQAEDDIADLRAIVDGLGEAHTLGTTTTDVPNTDSTGAVMYGDSTGVPAYVTDSGLQMNVTGAQTAFFPGNTVTAASLTNLAQGTYQGNDAGVGSMYELEVWGNGTTGSSLQTLRFAVLLGGTLMSADITFGNTAFNTTGLAFRWCTVARVICHTPGVSATWTSFLRATVNSFSQSISPGNSNTATAVSCESSGTTTKDSTGNQAVGVSAAWGATTGAPTLTSQVAVFKKVC